MIQSAIAAHAATIIFRRLAVDPLMAFPTGESASQSHGLEPVDPDSSDNQTQQVWVRGLDRCSSQDHFLSTKRASIAGSPIVPAEPLPGHERAPNGDHAVPFLRCQEGVHDGVSATSIPQDKPRRNPGIGSDNRILRPSPGESILVPELRALIPSDVLQVTNPLAIPLDEPAEASSEIRFLGESRLAIQEAWQLEHAQRSLSPDPGSTYSGIPSLLLDSIFLHSPPVTSQRQILPSSEL